MKNLQRTFLKGLLAVLPVLLTLSLLVWLVTGFESLLAPLLKQILPEGMYIPGLGLLLAVVFVFLLGLVIEAWVFKHVWRALEAVLNRTPLVRDIYGAISQLFEFFSGKKDLSDGSVVMVKIGDPPLRLLGLLTMPKVEFASEDMDDHERDKLVGVYLPMSYQVGGFTVYVAKDEIEPVDMSPEKAMRLTVTAGIESRTSAPRANDKSD